MAGAPNYSNHSQPCGKRRGPERLSDKGSLCGSKGWALDEGRGVRSHLGRTRYKAKRAAWPRICARPAAGTTAFRTPAHGT